MPEQGLYRKFVVHRVDGKDLPGRSKSNAKYFVLDLANDRHARKAIRAYIDSLNTEFPKYQQLARDLNDLLTEFGTNDDV